MVSGGYDDNGVQNGYVSWIKIHLAFTAVPVYILTSYHIFNECYTREFFWCMKNDMKNDKIKWMNGHGERTNRKRSIIYVIACVGGV